MLQNIHPQLRGAREQFAEFVETLFSPTDFVEIRAISSTSSRVIRSWATAESVREEFDRLQLLNEEKSFNVYFGVNPRRQKDGTKASVSHCRTVWADLDNVSVGDALQRCRHFSQPSVVVNSGHGVHLYWLLEQPVSVASDEACKHFEGIVRAFQRDIGSDATHDVTRLMRLPGLLNQKANPVPCTLVSANREIRISNASLSQWESQGGAATQQSDVNHSVAIPQTSYASRDMQRIRGLIHTLDRETHDRSRRDFWVVCRLLRLGISPGEVKTLVDGKSKFVTEDYAERTIANAMKLIQLNHSPKGG